MDMLWGRVKAFDRRRPTMRRGYRASLLAVVVAAAMLVWYPQPATAGEPAAPPEAYRLGIFPYVPVQAIDRIYGPVATQFAEDLGRPIHLKTKPTFEKFAEELRRESYDIILVHPFFYVEARDQLHYLPLARVDEPMTAVLMVRDDAPIATLADLKGKTIGLPPALAAVTELLRAPLIDAGLVPGIDVAVEHYRSKQSCMRAVAAGRVDACGLSPGALAQIDPNNNFKLRAVFETDEISNFVFAAHARVREADRVSISRSILAWPFTAKGRAILSGGHWTRFVVARDQDYDDVRRYVHRMQKYAQR
jgi:phosphonate transport system substrate-binding protein